MTAVCCQGLALRLRLRLKLSLESRQSPFSLLFIIQMLISKLSNNNCSQMLSNFNWAICVILIYIFKQQQLRNEQIKFSKCCPQIVWVVGVASVTAAVVVVVVVVCRAVFLFAVNVTASRCGGIGCKFFVLWSRFWGNIHSNNNNNIQQQQQQPHPPLSLSLPLILSLSRSLQLLLEIFCCNLTSSPRANDAIKVAFKI